MATRSPQQPAARPWVRRGNADDAQRLRSLWVQVLQGLHAAMRQPVDAERAGRARQRAAIGADLSHAERSLLHGPSSRQGPPAPKVPPSEAGAAAEDPTHV